jgi:hypothetical protein
MPTSADAFRSLVEGKITTEQYLHTLAERAEELRRPAAPSLAPKDEPAPA